MGAQFSEEQLISNKLNVRQSQSADWSAEAKLLTKVRFTSSASDVVASSNGRKPAITISQRGLDRAQCSSSNANFGKVCRGRVALLVLSICLVLSLLGLSFTKAAMFSLTYSRALICHASLATLIMT